MPNPLRPQPYRLKWPLSPHQVEGIDEMLEILFKKLREVEQNQLTPVPSGGGSGSTGLNQGAFLLLDRGGSGGCCDDVRWPWGPFGTVGGSTPTSDPQWSVLTNGDPVTPELIFAGGDVIMLETF